MTVEVVEASDGWKVIRWATPSRGVWVPCESEAEARQIAGQMLRPS